MGVVIGKPLSVMPSTSSNREPMFTSDSVDDWRLPSKHAAFNGMLAVSIVLDGRNKIVSGPQVRGIGLTGDDEYSLDDALDDLCEEAETAYKRLDGDAREIDETIESAISRAVKKAAFRIWERKPVVETTVLRI